MNDTVEKILEELKMEHDIEDLVSFDDLNVQEKLQENSYLVIHYKEKWINEMSILEGLEDKLDMLKGKQYDYYKFGIDKELTKTEIERYYLPGDKKVIQMKEIIRRQKVRADFFEMAWRALDKLGWNIKTFCTNEQRGM